MKEALSHMEAVKAKCTPMGSESSLSGEGRDCLNRLLIFSMIGLSQTLLNRYHEVFTNPCKCIESLKGKIRSKSPVGKESGFTHFLLLKVFAFALSDTESIDVYASLLSELTHIISQESKDLSHQVICDLVSEVYRLCIQAKFSTCQRNPSASIIKKRRVFCDDFSDPVRRMSRADFVHYSQLLDKEPPVKGRFEPTEEFMRDLEHFLPLILNGVWEKCKYDHYYCVPVCESENGMRSITMAVCPYCAGTSQC
jgi:hypothetical protein